MPPCGLRRRKFWKFDYEMVHSDVYLDKCGQHSAVLYICLPRLLSKYNINTENCSFLHVAAFYFFHPIFQGGGSADPSCHYVRTPMILGVKGGTYETSRTRVCARTQRVTTYRLTDHVWRPTSLSVYCDCDAVTSPCTAYAEHAPDRQA